MIDPGAKEGDDGDGDAAATCVKEAFKATSQQFKIHNSKNHKRTARSLWKIASKEIPRIHGEDGKRTVHLMEMLAYIGKDKYEYHKNEEVPYIRQCLSIANEWGLLTTSDHFKFYKVFWNVGIATIYFHSLVLMQAIVEESQDRELDLLKDILSSGFRFSSENYYSIWSLALKHGDEKLFSEFRSSDIISGWITEYKDKILGKHKTLLGKWNEHTVDLQRASLEEKSEKQDGDNSYKASLKPDKDKEMTSGNQVDSACLKEALKVTSQPFKTQNPQVIKSIARILWQLASKEIPRIHGEDGKRTVHLMEMMAYIGDDKYEYHKNRAVPYIRQGLLIASDWGLLTTSANFKFYEVFWNVVTIYFHSLAMMEAIKEESKDRELDLLKDILSSGLKFSNEHYYSIWSLALKYNDQELFSKFHPSDLVYGWTKSRHRQLFDNILEKHEVVFGKCHEKTMVLKSCDVLRLLRDKKTSLEYKWKKWDGDNGYKSCWDEFFVTRAAEDNADACIGGGFMFKVVEELFNLAKNPRPRPELEEKFLNAGFIMARDLLWFRIVDSVDWRCFVVLLSHILSYIEENRMVEDVPEFLSEWFDFVMENPDPDHMYVNEKYIENSMEMNILARCLRLANASPTRSLHRSILEILRSLITFYDEDMWNFYWEEYFSITVTTRKDIEAFLSRLLLFLVQCLEGLKKYSDVTELLTQHWLKEFRKKFVLAPGYQRGTAAYIREIDQIHSRCSRFEQIERLRRSS